MFGTFLGLEFREDSVVLTYVNNSFSGMTLLSSSMFPFSGSDEEITAINEYMSRHVDTVNGIFICMPDKWAITKFIRVPSTRGKSTLEQLMSFEVERHIPFNLEDIVYDFQVVDEVDKQYTVVFTAVRKLKVEFIKETLEKLSLKPDLITTASFAIFNAVELSGAAAGGWQHALGLTGKSGRTGKKGETNILLYIEKSQMISAIIHNGIYKNIKPFSFDENDVDAFAEDLVHHANDMKQSLGFEKIDKLILAGDAPLISEKTGLLAERLGVSIETLNELSAFEGNLKEIELRGLAPSVGACFIGLGMGEFSINMMPHRRGHNLNKKAPIVAQIFAGIIVLLLIAIASAEYVKNKKYLADINEALKKNEPEIAVLEEITSNINLFRERKALLQTIIDNEIALEVLAELTEILPRDAWITNLHYKGLKTGDKKEKGGELVISGFADSSSTLLPLLEDSPYFEKVEFVGPIKKTKDKEGFKLKAGMVIPGSSDEEKAESPPKEENKNSPVDASQ
jgi:Tfp pilus assembly PilM family ATPase/Tfp pilus assembly protein PilN